MLELLTQDLERFTTDVNSEDPLYHDFRPDCLPEVDNIDQLELFKLHGTAILRSNENPISAVSPEIIKILKRCRLYLTHVYKNYYPAFVESPEEVFQTIKHKFHKGYLATNGIPIPPLGAELFEVLHTPEINSFLKKFFKEKYGHEVPNGIDFNLYSAQFNKMGDFHIHGVDAKHNYLGLHEHKKLFDASNIFCPLTTVLILDQYMGIGDENHFHVVQSSFDGSTIEFSMPAKTGDLIINDWATLHRVPRLKNHETVRTTLVCQWQLKI